MESLKAKLRAWVGKYRRTLAKLPRQNGMIPSVLRVRWQQSITPVYGLSSRPCLIISSWFWTSSLMRSIGAAAVFEIPAAIPDRRKFSAKLRSVILEDCGLSKKKKKENQQICKFD